MGYLIARLDAWRSKLTLTQQIFIALLISIWTVTSIYFSYDIYTIDKRLTEMEKATMESVSPIFERIIEDSMLNGSREHIRELTNPLGHDSERQVYLLDNQRRLVDTDDLAEGKEPKKSSPPAPDAAREHYLDFALRSQPKCLQCHKDASETLGYVRLVMPKHKKSSVIKAHIRNHIAVMAILMVIIGIWALLIIHYFVHMPLAKILTAMRSAASGKLDTRILSPATGELGAVADGFNSMVSELERDRKEIIDLHRREVAHMERLAALGELAANLAHEVRSPLTGISSAIQILERESAPENPRREVLSKILQQLNRMDQTMENFLRYARMPEAVVRPFDITEALDRALFLAEPRLKSQKVSLKRVLKEPITPIDGDASQIEQVFLNLILNAIQAMPEGGALTIEAGNNGAGTVLVGVSDTGHGIASENLEKIFKPFFTTRPKGSGLGLPICRQIILAHAGEMWIESIPQRGTSVYFRLPAAKGSSD
ncbi:MAG: ATP-binding protein [Elusimicrobiota bacterium]